MKALALGCLGLLIACAPTDGVDGVRRESPATPSNGAGPEDSSARERNDAGETPGPGSNTGVGEVDGGGPSGPVVPKEGFFVVVGYGGLRARSSDGLTWTDGGYDTMQGGDDENLLRDVAGGDGQIIAGGWRLKHSTDAKTWVDQKKTGNWFGGMTYAKGVWVAAGGWGHRTWSLDGTTWKDADDTRTLAYRSLAYGDVLGGRWVAVGDLGGRAWSSDGKSWTNSTAEAAPPLSDVAFGNGVFVAVGHSSVMTSSDGGASWKDRGTPLTGGNGESITYGPAGFVTIGSGFAWTSSDGVDWTRTKGTSGAVAYGNGVYVAVDFHGKVARSNDAKVWTSAGTITPGGNAVQRLRFVTP